MRSDQIAVWVKAAVSNAGMSLAGASRALGLPQDALSKVIRNGRELSASELGQLAKLTNAPLPGAALATGLQPRYVPVCGTVAAGVWREVGDDELQTGQILALVDEKWPSGSVFALKVIGDSINLKAQDGDHVVVLAHDQAPRSLQSGDWVVVDRMRHDLRERTVKQAKQESDGRWLLMPRSSDPKHATPLVLGVNDGERVELVGYVLTFNSAGVSF